VIKKSSLVLSVLGLFFLFPILGQAADYVNVPAMAFNSATGAETFQKKDDGAESYFYATGAVIDQYFYAPVYFPDSAQGKSVKRISVRLYDNISDFPLGRLSVYLCKVDINSGNVYTVFSIDSGAISTPGEVLLHDSTGANKEINNKKYAWYLRARFHYGIWGDKLRLYSVRIKY